MSTMVEGQVTGFARGSEEAHDPDRSLYDVALSVDGRTIATRSQRGAFTLVTASGERISVETDASTQLLPREEETDSWGELLAHPLSSLFEREAPGDHVKVTLAWTSVTPGARIAVLAADERSLINEGYRGTKGAAQTIRAAAIATGDSAGALLSEWRGEQHVVLESSSPDVDAEPISQGKSPPVLPPLLMVGISLVAAAIAALGLGHAFDGADARPEVQGFVFWILAAATIAAPIYWIRMQAFIPWFLPITEDEHIGPGAPHRTGAMLVTVWGLWVVITGLSYALMYPLTGWMSGHASRTTYAGLIGTITALISGWFAVRLYLCERPHARVLRLLIGAATYEAGPVGSRALELTVARGSLHRKRREDLDQITRWDSGWRARVWTKDYQRPLFGRTPAGTDVEIRCDDALFASLIRACRFRQGEAWMEGVDTRGMTDEEAGRAMFAAQRAYQEECLARPKLAAEVEADEGKCITEEWILPGSSLLVLARFREENGVLVAESTGPESLILFGAHENARKSARRELLKHYAGVGALALLTISTLLIGWVSPLFWS